jgi:sugar transferase (PEP-CTERM/EpsH1 system associated)
VRILFLTERFPYPLHDGGNLRTYHVLQGLASRHDVHLVAHRRPEVDAEAVRAVEQICTVTVIDKPPRWRAMAGSLLTGRVLSQPFFITRNWSAPLLAAADNLLRESPFDAIHFNHLDTACYSLGRKWPQRYIFDTHNCLSAMAKDLGADARTTWAKLLYQRESYRLREAERAVCRRMNLVLTCSDDEAGQFAELAGEGNFVVAPNGVDCRQFEPAAGLAEEQGAIVFTGAMGYFPNQDAAVYFCEQVLPLLEGLQPSPKVYLVGKDPPPAVRALHNGTSIIVTGMVDDVRPFLQRASVVVVPLRHGAGTRLKILEAFAMGKAVVSTHKGAEGIAAIDGQEILLAADADQLAAQIHKLWQDERLRQDMGAAAARLARDQYDWLQIQETILNAYRQVEGSTVAVR